MGEKLMRVKGRRKRVDNSLWATKTHRHRVKRPHMTQVQVVYIHQGKRRRRRMSHEQAIEFQKDMHKQGKSRFIESVKSEGKSLAGLAVKTAATAAVTAYATKKGREYAEKHGDELVGKAYKLLRPKTKEEKEQQRLDEWDKAKDREWSHEARFKDNTPTPKLAGMEGVKQIEYKFAKGSKGAEPSDYAKEKDKDGG